MSRPKKFYKKLDFSDKEIEDQIKDEIRDIREQNLKEVQEQQKIHALYSQHKEEKRIRKMLEKDANKNKLSIQNTFHAKDFSDEEDGEINQKPIKHDSHFNDFATEGLSISNLGEHIRPLTLTRNKIVDLLNSRRFEELVKGCFVRYLIDSNASTNNNSYIIAQIVGVAEGTKEYNVNNVKTKVLLKLQQTSQNVVTLSLQLISNQHPPGGLEIEKWLQTNRNKIPKEKELKEKLDQHKKLLVEQISSSEIDKNIWKKAKKIAETDEQPKEDITHLIDFVTEKQHNLLIQIQQIKIGRKVFTVDLQSLQRQQAQTDKVLQKLKDIRERYITSKQNDKKGEPIKRQKKYSWNVAEQKRSDAVNQKCKARFIMLATYEGCNKLKNQIIENHKKEVFELD